MQLKILFQHKNNALQQSIENSMKIPWEKKSVAWYHVFLGSKTENVTRLLYSNFFKRNTNKKGGKRCTIISPMKLKNLL